MSSTDQDRVRQVAGDLFDKVICPLAEARRKVAQQPYFPLAGEQDAESYFVRPLSGVMQPADYEFPGGGTAEGLIEALANYWTAQGETALAGLAPGLREIAEELKVEAEAGDGNVSILCYTMF